MVNFAGKCRVFLLFFWRGGGGVDLDQFRGLGWGRFMWTIWGGEERVDHGGGGWEKNLYTVFCFNGHFCGHSLFNPSLSLASEKL